LSRRFGLEGRRVSLKYGPLLWGDYLLPTTYYLLPTTYYLVPTTYYLVPTTYYLRPTGDLSAIFQSGQDLLLREYQRVESTQWR